MDKKNRTVKRVVVREENGVCISEIQEFERPEGYRDAFKRYYPQRTDI